MRESDDYTVDLDDLIYDEEDGRPSERWVSRAVMPGLFYFSEIQFPTLQNESFPL